MIWWKFQIQVNSNPDPALRKPKYPGSIGSGSYKQILILYLVSHDKVIPKYEVIHSTCIRWQLRTWCSRIKKIRSFRREKKSELCLDLIKCLQQIKLQWLLLTCSPISELSSNIEKKVDTKVDIFLLPLRNSWSQRNIS